MVDKKSLIALFLCYLLWGFQPLYWAFIPNVDSFTMLGCRIVMAAVFSVILLAASKRLSELKALFNNKSMMKYLLPAVVFLLGDWAVYLVVINAGHVLDVSLGYYLNPLILFASGVVIYKEKCTRIQLFALCVAAVGVVVSTVAFGSFPLASVVIAVDWALYATLKKNVKLDGIVSIAAETLILTPLAIAFLLLFKRPEMAALNGREICFLLGSGIVTALPMFLYSNCVSRLSLIVMCFAQYLSPTFNLFCGIIRHESFSPSQLVSFAFFISAIVIFTVGEMRAAKQKAGGA